MSVVELKVSISTYNEIANALEAQGKKPANNSIITLEKDDKIIDPIDWRLARVRENCTTIAAQAYGKSAAHNNIEFVDFVNQIYEFVLKGTVYNHLKPLPVSQKEWK